MNLAVLAIALLANPTQDLQKFGRSYGLEIEVRKSAYTDQARGYTVSGATALDPNIARYAEIFRKEWALYPKELMAKAQVKKIVFSERIRVNTQFRAAVPAFDLEAMYYDVALGAGRGNYQQSVIHHEFFHMIDQRMGVLYIDPEWSALNPAGFKYGSGGHNMREGGAGALVTDIPGFLTPYSTSGVEEDKAELFAKLIVEPEFVRSQAKVDPILAAKIVLLKKRLADFHPKMGEEFWEDVAWYQKG